MISGTPYLPLSPRTETDAISCHFYILNVPKWPCYYLRFFFSSGETLNLSFWNKIWILNYNFFGKCDLLMLNQAKRCPQVSWCSTSTREMSLGSYHPAFLLWIISSMRLQIPGLISRCFQVLVFTKIYAVALSFKTRYGFIYSSLLFLQWIFIW